MPIDSPAGPIVYLLSAFSRVETGYYWQYHPGEQGMRASPKDWSMSSLEVVARHYGMTVRKSGGSHFVFLHSRSEIAVSIPFRRPIKPIYIAQFLALIDDIGTRE